MRLDDLLIPNQEELIFAAEDFPGLAIRII
jgi:hypothetical protein